jgi:DNA (cytosine-5)-methyltransferase 1
MKILNLYSGIGGNRAAWAEDHQVTAVEKYENVASVYHKYFPEDHVVVGDAHQYLLNHYHEYDFIWSSPSCITHSCIRLPGVKAGRVPAIYPDMNLYQEILFLQEHFKGKFVVENVKPYYQPLIPPTRNIGRHLFWSNFPIGKYLVKNRNTSHNYITHNSTIYGFTIKSESIENKRQVLRNLIDPSLGNHILKSALMLSSEHKSKQLELPIFCEA